MIYRMNSTLEKILAFSDMKHPESKTQFRPKPEGAYEKRENNKALLRFLIVQTDNTTMKTVMTIYSEKDIMELKFENSSFFHNV